MTIRLYFPKKNLLIRTALLFAVVGPLIPGAIALFNPFFLIGSWMIGSLPAALAGVFFALGANLIHVTNPGHSMSKSQIRLWAATLGAFSGLLAIIPFWLIAGEPRSAISLFWGSWIMPVLSVPSGAICGALFATQLWPTDEAQTAV